MNTKIGVLIFFSVYFVKLTAQNVGIGNETPESRLHIHQTENSDPDSEIQLTNIVTGNTDSDGIKLSLIGVDLTLRNQELGGLTLQYSEGDFTGFTDGEWKSFTKVKQIEALSYDEFIPFSDCANLPFWLNSNISGEDTDNSCGTIYDSGGPFGDYINNEDYIFYVASGFENVVKVIIEELVIENNADSLKLGMAYGEEIVITESILEPDTFLFRPSYYMYISFKSDFSVTKPGFKIRWEFLDPSSIEQPTQFTGFYYDQSKKAVAMGMNIINSWDSLGVESVTMGTSTIASGNLSFAVGSGAKANGTYAVAIGSSAYATDEGSFAIGVSSKATHLRSTAIGYSCETTADNFVVIGRTSIANIGGYQNWSNLSDGRFKENIQESVPGLSFVNRLRPVTYTLDINALNEFINLDELDEDDHGVENAKQEVRSGFIAQEVLTAAEEIDFDFSGVQLPSNESDHFSLRYAEFVVPLVKAVQELSEENQRLKEKVMNLESIETRLHAIEMKMNN